MEINPHPLKNLSITLPPSEKISLLPPHPRLPVKVISIRLFSKVIIIQLLTYFLAVWSTAELRLKYQWTKYIENKKTQDETSKEHTRLWRMKRWFNLIYANKIIENVWRIKRGLSFMLTKKTKKGKNNIKRKIRGNFAVNEARLQLNPVLPSVD